MILMNGFKALFLLLTFALCSCSTMQTGTNYLPATFTTINIMKVHPGMTSDEIIKLFGNPKSIGQAVCGGGSWTCITWEYGKHPYDHARFTFNGDSKPAVLNDFDIDREKDGQTLPDSFTTENVMKIKQGTSSKEILRVFGYPKDVSQGVCGGGSWICTTWEYGNFPYERASFTFSGKHDSLILNDFKVEKE